MKDQKMWEKTVFRVKWLNIDHRKACKQRLHTNFLQYTDSRCIRIRRSGTGIPCNFSRDSSYTSLYEATHYKRESAIWNVQFV